MNKPHRKHAQVDAGVIDWCSHQLTSLANKNMANDSLLTTCIQPAPPPVYGLVLCGGESTRMGRDKSSIAYHQKAQREYVAELLSRFCNYTFISCNRRQAKDIEHLRSIEDAVQGLGPAGGILSAFQRHPTVAWLVVACDLPYLNSDTIQQLMAHRNPAKTATCFWDAAGIFPEPLVSIWEPKAYPAFLRFVSENYTCPRKFLINTDVETITAADASVFANVNTATEYEEAIQRLAQSKLAVTE